MLASTSTALKLVWSAVQGFSAWGLCTIATPSSVSAWTICFWAKSFKHLQMEMRWCCILRRALPVPSFIQGVLSLFHQIDAISLATLNNIPGNWNIFWSHWFETCKTISKLIEQMEGSALYLHIVFITQSYYIWPASNFANFSLEFSQNHSLWVSRLFFPYQPLNTGDDSHEPVVPATCQIQKFSVDRRRGHVVTDGNVGMDGKHQ